MKNLNFINFLSFLLLIFISFSCSIEKRLHTGGYHLKFNKNPKNTQSSPEKKDLKIRSDIEISNENLVSLNDGQIVAKEFVDGVNSNETSREKTTSIPLNHNLKSKFVPSSNNQNFNQDETCDTLITREGEELIVKILEFGESTIKYKKCDQLEGPTYTIKMAEVFMIKYANGAKDVFKAKEVAKVKNEPLQAEKKVTVEPFSIISFILGVIGIIIMLLINPVLGFFILIPALITGIVGIARRRAYNSKGLGMAIIGTVLGLLGTIIGVVILAVVLAYVS